jgi:hypothetical protein
VRRLRQRPLRDDDDGLAVLPGRQRDGDSGHSLTVNVIATNPLAGDSFEVDGLALTQ